MPPYIQRIEVAGGSPVDLLIADEHGTLPSDLDLRGNTKATQGTRVLYDKRNPTMTTVPIYTCLWDHEVDRTNPTLRVEIKDLPSSWINAEVRMEFYQGRWGSFLQSKKVVVKSIDSLILELKVFSVGWDLTKVPFGFQGEPVATLYATIGSEEKSERIWESIPMEFYCLSANYLASEIFGNGIPLLLLRMFVLPMGIRFGGEISRDHWVSLVTSIVHGSLRPFDGSGCSTEDHWLRYESFGGSATFAGEHGGSINVQAWLDAYQHWKIHGEHTSVNCYDQAAITEIALSLGIPHDCIHWEYHQVYGFIASSAKLVGWGNCNNPYFEGNEGRKVVADDDPERWPFRNHAYLSITEAPLTDKHYTWYNAEIEESDHTRDAYLQIAKNFEAKHGRMKMIDTCAGPHVGTETREEYEKTIIRIEDPSKSFSNNVKASYYLSPKKWVEKHYLGAGMTSLSDDPLKAILSPEKVQKFHPENDRIRKILNDTPVSSSPPANVVKILQEDFQRTVNGLVRAENWTELKWLDIRPFDNGLMPASSTISETKCRFQVKGDGYSLSMRLASCKDGQAAQARDQLAYRLAYDTVLHESTPLEKLDDLSAGIGLTVLGRNSKGRRIRAFARYGLGVEITGDLVDSKYAQIYDKLAKVVGKELLSY